MVQDAAEFMNLDTDWLTDFGTFILCPLFKLPERLSIVYVKYTEQLIPVAAYTVPRTLWVGLYSLLVYCQLMRNNCMTSAQQSYISSFNT